MLINCQLHKTHSQLSLPPSLSLSLAETRVKSDWAATLARAPALGFLKKAGSGVFQYWQ